MRSEATLCAICYCSEAFWETSPRANKQSKKRAKHRPNFAAASYVLRFGRKAQEVTNHHSLLRFPLSYLEALQRAGVQEQTFPRLPLPEIRNGVDPTLRYGAVKV